MLTPKKLGSLDDAYESLKNGKIICNPKYTPWRSPEFKYCNMQLMEDGETIYTFGIGKTILLSHFIANYGAWKDGWEIYYENMYNDRVVSILGKDYRLSNHEIKKISDYVCKVCGE